MVKLYVTYFIAQPHKVGQRMERSSSNVRSLFPASDSDRISEVQKQAVNQFIDSQGSDAKVLDTCIEILENRKPNKWSQLERAIDICRLKHATLVVAELGTLTHNESFSQLLLSSGVEFYCCDQPFVNHTILEALHKHAQVHRKHHGNKIREGLRNTTAKSGNPNAADVIRMVNEPKKRVASVFADLLLPIISDFRRKGYSQRQMVRALNEEGFTAPEGGKWVLSQLQKVLDRVRLNEVARDARGVTEALRDQNYTEEQIAAELNAKGISSLKRTAWDEAQVKKLLARLDQIKDIESINKFVLELIPIIHAYKQRNLSIIDMLYEFDRAGLQIQATQPVVA